MADMPDAQEIEALKKALAQAHSELRMVRTERDLLKEQLNRFKRQLFDAKSEAAGATQQKDLFFDEAEAEGAQAQPLAEDGKGDEGEQVDVQGHKRAKRGRKPLNAAMWKPSLAAAWCCPKSAAATAPAAPQPNARPSTPPCKARQPTSSSWP